MECISKRSDLMSIISSYYEKHISFIAKEDSAYEYETDTSFNVDFFIDRRYILRYSIPKPNVIREYGAIYLGIATHFTHTSELMNYKESEKFSRNTNKEAVEQNLRLMDVYLAKREEDELHELYRKFKEMEKAEQ